MVSDNKSGWIRRIQKLVRFDATKNSAEFFASVVRLAQRTAAPIDAAELANGPFMSFVAVLRDTPKNYLQSLLASFHTQRAGSAELILCDHASAEPQTLAWLMEHEHVQGVRSLRAGENHDIVSVTNMAISFARGAWISLIGPNDALAPCVVQLIAETAKRYPQCQFIYTDEVITDEKLKPTTYLLKPAYDEVMLSGGNYINHLACYRRDRLLAVGGLRAGFDGAEDYDLLLRYVRNLRPDEIKHLPYPGYQWRAANSLGVTVTNRSTDGACKALAELYPESTPPVRDTIIKGRYRVRFDKVKKRWPLVSIVIPNQNSFPLISRVLADLASRTDYPDLEVIVVDNGTTDRKVLDLYAKGRQEQLPFKCFIEPGPFNFSRQVNRGMASATGELILLLNNDIEVIDSDWLREMVSCFDYPDTGIVGARLLYPNHRLQHAGTIIGLRNGLAAHWLVGRPKDYPGPMARLQIRQSLTAVTGACMLISRACLKEVGKFDEIAFPVAYNDVDFCLRAVAQGFRVVWTPFATLIHRESASRGKDNRRPAKLSRLRRERENLRRRHNTGNYEDRAFSPWYGRSGLEPSIVLLDQLPKAR
jgi:O-antigen biosynthesis protein